ncbi:uncharacterized protein TNCV_4199051 [Trichonephila clavipes]|uniref:DUF5641 domain-containing protein n=1 Tax=Trichonephila clavipes TaxID=2585209 RepID=A0A8X7BHQ3_TRICX|nr:uncharacterized protein TNCV_4199051 [Trichonephila clavipes]
MERRFQVDKDFERQYKKFMIEYESLGHMMPVENNEKSMDPKNLFSSSSCCYERLNEIAFSADIQQMYRQILIDQEDQNFQRIVWRESKDSPIREYKLCTLWLLKLDWDSPLPEALATKWKTFQKEFEQVCSIHIPRWIHTTSKQITLHGFCDASELAYASVIYAVQPQADGNTKVTLQAKRCGSILAVFYPRNWKPYIANRTSEILDLVPADSWRYVPTKMNPADIACRGLSPKELPTCVLWVGRPSMAFLYITNCKARSWQDEKFRFQGKYHVPPLTTYERRQASEALPPLPLSIPMMINFLFAPVGILSKNEEDNIPPATWPLGKVIETHPGKDGVVRVVTLRTVKGRFKRPIHKLCKLPLHQE